MRSEITGIILAGGRGQRMGGIDKGWAAWRGTPLIEQVLTRLRPQVDQLIISANRNLDRYRQLGHPVVSDQTPNHPGPLAGILATGRHAQHDWLLVVPCDLPGLPLDLSPRLLSAAQQQGTPIALAHDGLRHQQLCLLLHNSLLDDLDHYLHSGQRRVISWIERHPWTAVDFSDQADAFTNVNQSSIS